MGFVASSADTGLYILKKGDCVLYLLAYVDDLLLASKSRELLNEFKCSIAKAFNIRDLGAATLTLGMEIIRDRPDLSLKLVQSRMISDLLAKYGLGKCHTGIFLRTWQ